MPYVRPIKTLRAFYISIAITLACLAIVTQIFIQAILYQEHLGRVVESQIAQSAILSQQIQQDMLIQLIPGHKPAALDRLKVEVPAWEKAQDSIYKGNSSPDTIDVFNGVKKDYATMESAVSIVIQEEEQAKPDKTKVSKAISDYFYANNTFLPASEKAFSTVAAEDDIQSEKVHWIELLFCGLTLTTIIAEAVLVARPALQKLNQDVMDMQDLLQNRQKSQEETPVIKSKEIS